MKYSMDDSKYIVGIDLGRQSTGIGYLNQSTLDPVLLDISGGYQDAGIPTVMQYLIQEDEWLVGHFAKLNRDMEASIYMDQLVQSIETKKALQLGQAVFRYEELLAIYIKSLLSHFHHINPKATIEKVVLSISDAGYKALQGKIDWISNYIGVGNFSCIKEQLAIGRYLQHRRLLADQPIHVLDYGYGALKHYKGQLTQNQLILEQIETYEGLGCALLEDRIHELLKDLYCKALGLEFVDPLGELQIEQMLFQYYVWFFQKLHEEKPLRVFYAFAYPPFKSMVSLEEMKKLVTDIQSQYFQVLLKIDSKEQLFLMGNGYRMPWTRLNNGKDYKKFTHLDVIVKGAVLEGSKEILELEELEVIQKASTKYAYGILTSNQMIMLINKNTQYDTSSATIPLILERKSNELFEFKIIAFDPEGIQGHYETQKLIEVDSIQQELVKRVGLTVKIDSEGELKATVEPLPL